MTRARSQTKLFSFVVVVVRGPILFLLIIPGLHVAVVAGKASRRWMVDSRNDSHDFTFLFMALRDYLVS